MNDNSILSVEHLDVSFRTSAGNVHAIRDVSFDLPRGKTLALVGESGSGKSATVKAVTGLLAANATVHAGKILFRDSGDKVIDLLTLNKREMRRSINGQQISMVFQDPMTSLDPTMTIGAQIVESIRLHSDVSQNEAAAQSVELLRRVGFEKPESRMKNYPHQLSGGQRQRVVIACALSCSPKILICDEPTTALDVTTQARILDLIAEIQRQDNLSIIFITHDLGVVARVADYVNVMYAGQIIETGTAEDIFLDPRHPYTWGLLLATPDSNDNSDRLYTIPGSPPNLLHEPKGDAFAERNQFAMRIDKIARPPMFKISETHFAATWLLHDAAPKVEKPTRLINQKE